MRDEPHLAPRPANFRPLTPLDFLDRAVASFADETAVIWRDTRLTWAEFGAVVGRLAAALTARGIGPGDVVSVMCPNRPEMLAAHYAVPALGAVLNSVNTRLDAAAVGWILGHSESRLLLADPTSAEVARSAAEKAGVPCETFGEDTMALLSGPDPAPFDLTAAVTDEWQPIALNYTSGTTGNPKGAVLTHRGAALNALGNVITLKLSRDTSYLWTLPMFHCNGWCHTWAVTAAGGVHVCLDRVEPAAIFDALDTAGITHMSCAPVVLYMLLNDPRAADFRPGGRVTVASGGAAPTETLIRRMEALGFDFLHLYGLTESYGPASLKEIAPGQDPEPGEKARLLARQGIRHATANRIAVIDDAGAPVPADGVSVGEIVLSGNTLTAGYYGDAAATEAAFAGGVYHTGDLAVVHPGGDIEVRDRAKDVIITGGENVSSLEVESALHAHPDVLMAAVVARPDPKWGETLMAFVELRPGSDPAPEALEAHCRERLAGFKIPRYWEFRELPKTATGKIQKFVLRESARAAAEAGE
ncbi:AMP-binding protein [Rhodobacterales bacterium HKCCE2091]|nr:AMP-binding protein [Rhodobacterales bacterium HKCCE2091]